MVCAGPAGGWHAISQYCSPGTRACGHFTGMATRGLHARGVVAPGDNFRVRGSGCHIPLHARSPPARSVAHRPCSVAATAGARMGTRAAREAARPGASVSRHLTGTATRRLHARGAGAPDGTSGCPGWWHNVFPAARCRRPFLRPPRVVRAATAAGGRGCVAGGGWRIHGSHGARDRAPLAANPAASASGPHHRDADAQPARAWRGCAVRYFWVRRLGGIMRSRSPISAARPRRSAARGPSPRPPACG
jgi:hypothetical protein